MGRYYYDDEPEEMEPGYDPGPDDDDRVYDNDDEGLGLIDGVGFADPGGNSALRAATRENPRIHPCPSCDAPEVLTPADVARGYQCNRCADLAERGGY